MAIEFDIQVQNGTVKITVGGQSSNPDDGSGGGGKAASPGTGGGGKAAGPGTGGGGKAAGPGTGGREQGDAGFSAPVVIGPIVICGELLGTGTERLGGGGKAASPGTGGGGKAAGPGTGGGGKAASPGTGGGSPEGACCAPVVIGPIVITGCYSGQGDGSSNGHAGSKAVTIDPPAHLGIVSAPAHPFTLQYQQHSNWCWAAVAVSIHDFFNPPETLVGPSLTQPELATLLLKKRGITTAKCSETPVSTVCNQPQALDVALAITRNLMPHGALAEQHLTFECIQKWVSAQIPVAARIKWRGEGAHFIALDGCKVMSTGQQLVHVQDPEPHTSPTLWDYDELVEHYQEDGYWIDTYLVMKNSSES